MVSEAAATAKPVHIVDLDGGSAKFERFHAAMRTAGIARPFRGAIEHGVTRRRTTPLGRRRKSGAAFPCA